MWRRWTRAAAALVVIATAAPAAGAAEPRVYVVDAARAQWTVGKGDGRYHLWIVEAARYRDLASREVEVLARVERLDCRGTADDMSCSGRGKYAAGVPEVFEFAQDLSGAALALGPHEARWTAYAPTEDVVASLVPYPYFRNEACTAGSGVGSGAFREMRIEATLFGRDPGATASDAFAAMGSYVLETECDPSTLWARGRSVPQWLRRAETSSFLSMLERPSIPTSLALS